MFRFSVSVSLCLSFCLRMKLIMMSLILRNHDVIIIIQPPAVAGDRHGGQQVSSRLESDGENLSLCAIHHPLSGETCLLHSLSPCYSGQWREGGREGRSEGGKEGGRKKGREERREGGREERGKEEEREGGKEGVNHVQYVKMELYSVMISVFPLEPVHPGVPHPPSLLFHLPRICHCG